MPDDLSGTPGGGHRRRCDNPECGGHIVWPKRARRPRRFCSSACGQRSRAAQGRLLSERQRLEDKARSDGLLYVDRRAIESRIALLDWLLSAYPALRD